MFQLKKLKSSSGVCHAHKFCLRTDTFCDMWCTCKLNTLNKHPEHTIHVLSSYGWAKFWPELMRFLVDMLKHAH